MINRNYLPYKSAREYVDKGMAKWGGFILSDHSSALSSNEENPTSLSNYGNTFYINQNTDLESVLVLLSQAYINKLTISLSSNKKSLKGKICEFVEDYLYLSCDNKTEKIKFKEIVRLTIISD